MNFPEMTNDERIKELCEFIRMFPHKLGEDNQDDKIKELATLLLNDGGYTTALLTLCSLMFAAAPDLKKTLTILEKISMMFVLTMDIEKNRL